MAVTTKLISEPDRDRKDFLVVACLTFFIFLSVSNGLWDFPSVPIEPKLFCKSWHPTWNIVIAGLPRARSTRGTEPHTHGIWSTSFRVVVTWLTVTSTDCTGRVGETIKRKGGVSQACLGKSSSFIYDIYDMVNWQLSKQDSHWPVSHDHMAGSCVNSSRWHYLFGSCPLTR